MRLAWLVGIGVPLLVAGHTVRGAYLDLRVDGELSRLELDRVPAPEPADVAAARAELKGLLRRLAELPPPEGYPYFGFRFMIELDNAELLGAGVADRASFFEGLERLPDALRETSASPSGQGTPRLFELWRAGGALGARAWLSAREPGGSAAAGRDLARALEIARVMDDGSSTSRLVRRSLESSMLEHAEDLVVLPGVDREAVLAPLAAELLAGLREQDVRAMLGTDVRWMVRYSREQLDELPWYRAWWERPFAMGAALEQLELYADHVVVPGTLPEPGYRPEAPRADRTLLLWSTLERQERETVMELRSRLEAL